MTKTSLQSTRNKENNRSRGRTSTFFPSFIGLALNGNDLYVCEATKRFNTKFKSGTVKDFLSRDPSTLKSNLKELKGHLKPVVLSWPRERTMVRDLFISNSNLQELREALAAQLDTLFPFKPEDAYFDLYPCGSFKGTDKSAKERKICLFAINKKELDDVLGRLKVIGLMPSRIIPSPLAFLPMMEKKVEGAVCLYRDREGQYVYNLYCMGELVDTHVCSEKKLRQYLCENPPNAILAVGFKKEKLPRQISDTLSEDTVVTYPDASWESSGAAIYEAYSHSYDFQLLRPSKKRADFKNLYFISLIALLLSLLIAIPQISQLKDKERLNIVEAEIEGLKEHAFALRKLEGLAMVRRALAGVLESQKGYVPRADILLELSRLLPENTWIEDLSIKGETFEMTGFTTSLAKIMFILENSPIFSNVELVPPVESGKDGKEHFRLKGNILREKTNEES